MNKIQKWIVSLMLIVPITILAFIIISDINIKDFPMWAIIGIPILILVLPFIFLLTQRSGQEIYKVSLQKQKKRFLTTWGIYIIFLVICLVILYFLNNQFFLPFLFIQIAFLLSVFFMRFRLFFPSKKKMSEDANQNEQEN